MNENFRAVRPHHRADICITGEKIASYCENDEVSEYAVDAADAA